MKPRSEIDRLISTIATTEDLLEPGAFESVCAFIRQSQCDSGAFADRGGRPDWYYSFFGFLLCRAFHLDDELALLKKFVLRKHKMKENSQIDRAVWVLLSDYFNRRFLFRMRVSVQLLFQWMLHSKQVNKVYQAFVTMLILNHFWGWPRYFAGLTERLTSAFLLNEQSPTSHLAAALMIRHEAGLDVKRLQQDLVDNALPEGGFVAFRGLETADMLSTAVAFYALFRSKADLRLLTPQGLNYVAEHFDRGAFLSGDGDMTCDVEYTFYGLMALGALTQALTER